MPCGWVCVVLKREAKRHAEWEPEGQEAITLPASLVDPETVEALVGKFGGGAKA